MSSTDKILSVVLAIPTVIPILCGLSGFCILAWHGRWSLIGYGIGLIVASGFILDWLRLPSIAFAAAGSATREVGHPIMGFALLWLGGFWQRLVTFGVVTGVFFFFIDGTTMHIYWPTALWGLAVAVIVVCPIVRMPEDTLSAIIAGVESEIVYALWVIAGQFCVSDRTIIAITLGILAAEVFILQVTSSIADHR